MAQRPRDIMDDLARHSELLSENVAKLTAARDHWRLLEAEYDALADEVRRAQAGFANDTQAQQTDLVRIRRDFDGQLVDHKTVCELLGARLGQPITRSVEQIRNAIERRLDYVRQNAATLHKQAENAANRLAAAQVIRQPGMPDLGGRKDGEDDDEEGDDGDELYGPVTDIMEELDSDGNVVNVRLNTPSGTQSQVVDILKRAGIDEIPEGNPAKAMQMASNDGRISTLDETDEPLSRKREGHSLPKPKPKTKPTPNSKPRRSVSFAVDTMGIEAGDNGDDMLPEQSPAAQRLKQVIQKAKEQESIVDASAALRADDSEEDAALRREMLDYSMSEIGPIVAQLDIEDDDEFNDEEDYDYDIDEDEGLDEEDQFGRSKYSIIDEAYRERMRELEKTLGVAPLETAETASITKPVGSAKIRVPTATEDMAESLGLIRIAATSSDTATLTSTSPAAQNPSLKKVDSWPKKVAFATELDIAPEDATSSAPPVPRAPKAPAEPIVAPLSDVVERSSRRDTSGDQAQQSSPMPPTAATAPMKKVSRFRREHTSGGAAGAVPALPKGPHEAPVRFFDQGRTVAPSGPDGETVMATVVEREPSSEVRSPDELDSSILLQETAMAYHRTRNRLIQKQGGFLQASEAAIVPLDEAEGGPRMSKFKAARLGSSFLP